VPTFLGRLLRPAFRGLFLSTARMDLLLALFAEFRDTGDAIVFERRATLIRTLLVVAPRARSAGSNRGEG
jgi:hypothetical protein